MPILPKLPAELWLKIFDLVIAPTLDPAGMCTITNFPETSLHLRFPREYGPIEDPHSQLEVVCRAFRSLIGPSPYFFIKNVTTPVPTTARAVYTPLHEAPVGYLRRVLVDPYRSRRIVTLYLTCIRSNEGIVPFDDLCGCSSALATLRNLTLSIFYLSPLPLGVQLWSRLRKAFPLLLSLVLRSALKRLENHSVRTAEETSPITFGRLEILDLGCFVPSPVPRFPALRHAASARCSRVNMEILAFSPLLDSLLLRGIDYGTRIDFSTLPQLISLGIPKYHQYLSLPLASGYPLYRMCIYMVSHLSFSGIVPLVTSLPTRYPVISYITIDLSLLPHEECDWARRTFTDAELQYSGLAVTDITARGALIIIGRIPVISRPDSQAPSSEIVPNAEPGPSGPPAPSNGLALSGGTCI